MTVWDVLFNPVTMGFVIGGLTNGIAIKMIFRPYRKVGLLGLEWQGLIPKRQPELAAKIATVVTTRLLTREKIVARFADPDVRAAIERLIREMIDRFLEQDLGALGQYLSPSEKTRLAETVAVALGRLGTAIEDWLATDAGHAFVGGLLDQALARCPDEILRHQEVDLDGRCRAYLEEFFGQSDLRAALKQGMARLVVDWANSARALGESLPPEAHEVLQAEMAGLAPVLQERVAQALFSPDNLDKIRRAVREAVEKEMNKPVADPGSFTGIIEMGARAVFKQPILERVEAMFAANVPELKAALTDAETRARFEKALLELLADLLARTPNDLLAGRSAASLDRLLERLTDFAEQGLHKPELREFLARTLAEEIRRLARRPARDLARMAGLPDHFPATWTHALCTDLCRGRISAFLQKEGWWLFDILVNLPIGRVARFANSQLLEQATAIALEHLLQVVSDKAPQVLEAVDMEGIVRTELLGYPPAELEKLVQTISARELRAITWLGGVLGALIGATQLLF
ncbi:MAG: hypothetical protein OZSIB_2249 [Candidatus Ozemobacter sibiricus]|uniref:DUF445 domain-containing protein n=1 Tax=Candidatus Ozemobacter sibiricus TaxID=2268124 RepID=A0A367ZTL3_9BACT|nr:MAG: hypothetical protein OZSIB_2249 [Candidatus Ozemobacter sibiricus]